jgi:transposase-like protein
MEDSPIPLTVWAQAFWGLCAGKKGISSKQLQRMTGLSYKSALYLSHRVRWAMADPAIQSHKLSGIIEADETFIGGRPRYPLGHPKRKKFKDKIAIMAVLQRGAGIRASVAQSVTTGNVKWMLSRWVESGSTLMTDEFKPYETHARYFGLEHHRLCHWRKEYVRADDRAIHLNSIESFWAVLKRGLHGTYHAVSREHLHRYLSEFQFRYNTRELGDGERLAQAVRQADGRRLCYREPGSGAA